MSVERRTFTERTYTCDNCHKVEVRTAGYGMDEPAPDGWFSLPVDWGISPWVACSRPCGSALALTIVGEIAKLAESKAVPA